MWQFLKKIISVQEEERVQGAGWLFHNFHPLFPSRVLSEQPCSTQLERTGNTSGAVGGPWAPWLGGGGEGWLSGSVQRRGLLKVCLVPYLKKKEGEEDTKTFPLLPRFCLAEKATFTGTLPCPRSYHSPVPCHPERGHFEEGKVKVVKPQMWFIISVGLQGRDQHRPGRPALVAKLKTWAFLVSCDLSRIDWNSPWRGICGSRCITLGHWLYSTELLIGGGHRPTNAQVISNNYLRTK